ncbi:MAG: Homoserine dehydrogenase [Chloroflexi bacterium]|nr:Homoserine dehydrogenase [Chloroflexota bacterium]
MSNSGGNRVVELVQYGLGGVGRALFGLVTENAQAIYNQLGVDLRYRALVDSGSVLHLDENSALSPQHLRHLAAGLQGTPPERLINQQGAVKKPSDLAVLATELDRLRSDDRGARLVVVDVSGASENIMSPVITAALRQGQRAVLANKRPLCGPIQEYRQLVAAAGTGANRLRYETTVGAALPVISTVNSLLDARDRIHRVNGTFSGTLAYLTSRLEEGVPYSQAVQEAKDKGFTEPDPRDDLGGVDVARKALILSRLLGNDLELKDVEIEPLYPVELAELDIPGFMKSLPQLDEEYAQRVSDAAAEGKVLRYLATVSEGKCRVGLEKVDKDSPFGRLQGTNNMIVFTTNRYNQSPLIVQGPGAGAEITASGVLSDILSMARK